MIIKTKKGYLEIRFRWKNKRRYFSMGCICKMHLEAAQKYVEQFNQLRKQCKQMGQPLPVDPPKPERIPRLGKLIAEYQSFTQTDDSLRMDLFFQILDYTRELNLTAEQSLKYLEQYEDNYRKLVTETRLKSPQAKAKRAATIATRRNSVRSN